MFEELKKKALKSSLLLTILWLVIGGVMVGLMATNMYHIVFGYADFTQLEPEKIKSQLVEFDMEVNFGCYMEEYEYNKDTGRSKTTDLYYVIWTGDENAEDYRYMSVKVPASMEKKMEAMADETEAGYLSDAISVIGKIKKLKDEEYKYFKEVFEESGWTEEEIAEGTLPYYIDCFDSKSTANGGFIAMFVIGMLFLLWGVVRIVKALSGGYLKKLKKDMEKAGYSEANIEADYASAFVVNEKSAQKVGRLMTYFILGADVRAIPNNKMVWAYMNTVTHRTNGIKTDTTYNVQIETEGAGSFSIGMDKEQMALDMLQRINETLPWVVVGYSDELKTLYRKNYAEFLNLRYNTCEHYAVEPGFAAQQAYAAEAAATDAVPEQEESK